MDIKILNGDWALNNCGMPICIYGETELLQNALLRLKIPRGAFLHDTELGSRFFEIDFNSRENAERLALLFAKEALAPLGGRIEVVGAEISPASVIKINAVTDCGTEVMFTL